MLAEVMLFIGATINALSASFGDVTNAIGQASEGDTVAIPADAAAWTTNAEINVAITITGAGANSTIISNAVPSGNANTAEGSLFDIDHPSGTVKIENIGIYGGYIDAGQTHRKSFFIDTGGGDTDAYVWFDNLAVNDDKSTFYIRSDANGLISSCNFTNVDRIAYFLGYNNTSFSTWDDPVTSYFGSANAWFMEDCHAEWTENFWNYADEGEYSWLLASGQGARWVVRHNAVNSTSETYKIGYVDQHGDQQPGNVRAVLFSEFYGNTAHIEQGYRLFNFRGGSGLIFSNVWWNDNASGADVLLEFQEEGSADHYPAYGTNDVVTNTYVWANSWTNDAVDTYSPLEAGTVSMRVHPDSCTNHIEFGVNVFTNAPVWYTPYTYPHPWRNWPTTWNPAKASAGGNGTRWGAVQ